jgi:hypothetical protein
MRTLFTHDPRVILDGEKSLLESSEFDELTESAAVLGKARSLLSALNGIAALMRSSFRPVSVKGHVRYWDDDGEFHQDAFVGIEQPVRIRTILHDLTIAIDDKVARPPPGSSESDRWARASLKDANLRTALSWWGQEHDPANMWKVWEIVRTVPGLTIDADNRRRFEPTLNDPALTGEAARHGRYQRAPTPDAMSLQEAEDFLADLLRQWCNSLV